MAKARKMVRLAKLVAEVNRRNRESTCEADVRTGWNELLAGVLMDADAYCGYRYLRSGEVPAGELPGIVTDADGLNTFPDETRREYLGHDVRGKREVADDV